MQNKFIGVLLGLAVFAALFYTVFKINFQMVVESKPSNNITEIGKGIMTDYIFPFELAGLLLLMTLIGAATLASYKLKEKE